MSVFGCLFSVIKEAKFQLMETHSDKLFGVWRAFHWHHSTQNTVTSDFLPGNAHILFSDHVLAISPQNWLKKTGGRKPGQAGSLLCQVTHRRSKYLSARSREAHAFVGRHVELCITPVADSVLWIPFPPSPH